MFKSIIAIILTLTTSFAASQTTCKIAADIYYINGVNKPSEMDVSKAADALEEKIGTLSEVPSGVHDVTFLYNDSNGLFFDIFYELASQKALEKKILTSDEYIAIASTALGLESTLTEAEILVVKEKYETMILSALSPETLALVSDFANKVTFNSLVQGYQAILVAHSQGNMFANELVSNLHLNLKTNLFRGLAVVNVASPAHIAPSKLWLTSTWDSVINSLARLQSVISNTLSPTPANFDASVASLSADKTGHGFSEVYLSTTLPLNTTPENSIVATLVRKVDDAMMMTNSFLDYPSYIYDANGNKIPKPVDYSAADSSVVQVCFPGLVGGL